MTNRGNLWSSWRPSQETIEAVMRPDYTFGKLFVRLATVP
jgi:hypothetical protein